MRKAYTEAQVRELFRRYVRVNFDTFAAYAKAHGVSASFVNAVNRGSKPMTRAMLNDIGVRRVVTFEDAADA